MLYACVLWGAGIRCKVLNDRELWVEGCVGDGGWKPEAGFFENHQIALGFVYIRGRVLKIFIFGLSFEKVPA